MWLSAFDNLRPEVSRVLFIAHREEILTQTMRTLRRIRPTATLGLCTGREKAPNAGELGASGTRRSRLGCIRCQLAPDTGV